MTIATNATILFDGTQDEVTTGSPGAVANNAFSASGDTAAWTNDDDAPLAAFVLKCQFATMPTAGSIGLFAQLLDVQSTNDAPQPDASFQHLFLGAFPIDFGASISTDFYTVIPMVTLPWLKTSQQIHFFIKNEGTGQSIAAGWEMWVTPITHGPHA